MVHMHRCWIQHGSHLCIQVLDVAMGCLASASVSDLPTLLKFITQQVTPKNSLEVTQTASQQLNTLVGRKCLICGCVTPTVDHQRGS